MPSIWLDESLFEDDLYNGAFVRFDNAKHELGRQSPDRDEP
jgi:hypothetical protein